MWVLCQVTGHPMLAADPQRVFMCFASLLNTLTHTRTLGNRHAAGRKRGSMGRVGGYIYNVPRARARTRGCTQVVTLGRSERALSHTLPSSVPRQVVGTLWLVAKC